MELVRKTTRNRLVTSHLPSNASIQGSCSLQGGCCVRRMVDGRDKRRKALLWLCVLWARSAVGCVHVRSSALAEAG